MFNFSEKIFCPDWNVTMFNCSDWATHTNKTINDKLLTKIYETFLVEQKDGGHQLNN